MRSSFLVFLIAACTFAQEITLPNKKDSFHFAIIGDTGTGDREQYQIAELMVKYREKFPYDLVILLGDNLYGGESPRDFESKFERPYKALLEAGVKFYAALGNHDTPNQRFYKNFNMGGERYYSFKPRDGIRFFALDSTYMSKEQLEWVDKSLAGSHSEWKICFFHHPMYSSGKRHGPDDELRQSLEPIFLKHNVSVVFTGHEHFYERLKPQNGIHYFIMGSSAKLRKGNIRQEPQTEKGFDQDNAFILAEIDGDKLYFQTISRKSQTVDSGVIEKRKVKSSRAAPFVGATSIARGVRLDVRHATTNNFTKQKLYDRASCSLRPATAEKLANSQQEFARGALGLKVFDCYGPLSIQRGLWALVPDERYVADPAKGSRHNRGAAVDLTLVRQDGTELPMPTGYDDFSQRAHRDHHNLPQVAITNRTLLERVMTKHGFVGLPTEWWHFDDVDPEKHPVEDVTP
jgi:D-alanyl-D-alanine dipeptidase